MNVWPLLAQVDSLQILAASALSIVAALISHRLKAVSLSGAFGMAAMGAIILGLGGIVFAVPLLFFFVSSSIFSAIKTEGKDRSLKSVHKGGPRDIWQVFANGGAGTIFVLVYFFTGNLIWFFPFLASLCESTSDTWATEIGTLYPDSPVSIVTLKGVDPGTSGGITILGTLASIGGALLTMLVACTASGFNRELTLFNTASWLIAANCGLAGSLLDSALGGSIQAQYRCKVCYHLVEMPEHCGHPAPKVRGLRFVTNDVVNFTSSLFAALAAAIIFLFQL